MILFTAILNNIACMDTARSQRRIQGWALSIRLYRRSIKPRWMYVSIVCLIVLGRSVTRAHGSACTNQIRSLSTRTGMVARLRQVRMKRACESRVSLLRLVMYVCIILPDFAAIPAVSSLAASYRSFFFLVLKTCAAINAYCSRVPIVFQMILLFCSLYFLRSNDSSHSREKMQTRRH